MKERNVWQVGAELIDKAKDLRVTDRYRIVTEHPIGKVDEIPLFPAIAIPVETKRGFECPTDHLDCLRTHLGRVTKVLIIGWRATEQHFLDLLKEHLKRKVAFQVVSGQKPQADEVVRRILDAGVDANGEAESGGFTEYIVSREAERFFSSES